MEHYDKYKNSGVEWIGEIPEGWEVKKLKYVADANPSNIDKKIKKMKKLPIEDQFFGNLVKELMMKKIYSKLNEITA
ncbi:hypothetical protein DO021_00815 [Desulfobacter hydrogenophilus]|uniref:Type I restriction modification DNA specificity domain-containing protein n=1 Tax=Desulfobacter hydrogenophilus TaxID=2291 RepID=A0A328FIN2_9BACT|nr:hypothetical protein [Desulfobacter hydrogenophilus]NDY72783.1 hypothetical protein [Desulfobacter hydrogenophilus]QBH13012.1 hypothetical protein EYB58_08830 [Desulfobacter hydrogenophilus]RAM03996.1 hypothetical protein DO021_00815 [Desulfobacter hydrogenophilus]